MTLGERIQECRQKAGMSQEKVAELVGVSRQAVTKWEAGQSSPNTANLFKLAEIFGTTVDFLLSPDNEAKQSPAEQIYYLYKMEEEKKRADRSARLRKHLRVAALTTSVYLAVYLLGRILWCDLSETSVMGWLFAAKPEGENSYLYGWLTQDGLFWWAMAVSVIPALFGKYRFSFVAAGYFVIGLAAGILLGPTEYGTGEYGWAYWGGIFLASIPVGVIMERAAKQAVSLTSRKGKGLVIFAAAGIVVMLLLVWLVIPKWKMP